MEQMCSQCHKQVESEELRCSCEESLCCYCCNCENGCGCNCEEKQ